MLGWEASILDAVGEIDQGRRTDGTGRTPVTPLFGARFRRSRHVMADIFDAYALAEMFEPPGEVRTLVRTAYEPVLAALQPMEPAELRFRADQMARAFTDRGVTYAFAGEERPWPLDLESRGLSSSLPLRKGP